MGLQDVGEELNQKENTHFAKNNKPRLNNMLMKKVNPDMQSSCFKQCTHITKF